MARPRIVIVGAGFAGLAAARVLAGKPVEVTLIDRSNAHVFQPLLYQVATAALSPAEIAWPIRALVRGRENISVALAEVRRIDPERRQVETDRGGFPYDFLIMAPGAAHSYFGHEDWAGPAPGLKTLADATAIRRRILSAFEAAELAASEEERRRLTTFVIVGGGPTGVELAGAVAALARDSLRDQFVRARPDQARVILIEAGPRLLASFPERLSAYGARALARMGVDVRLSTPVIGVSEGGVDLPGGAVPAGAVIWAAGVRASPLMDQIAPVLDRAHRAKPEPDLTLPGRPEIFVCGDAAAMADAAGQPVPGIAPAAKQMGRHAARAILARLEGRATRPFRYRHYGDFATIGRRAAIARFDHVALTGPLAWWLWGLVHIFFLIGARSRLIVAASWTLTALTRQRGARLILGQG